MVRFGRISAPRIEREQGNGVAEMENGTEPAPGCEPSLARAL